MILTDAGPLIALLNPDDRHHTACRKALLDLEEPIGTVWPVLTEAMYLLRVSWRAQKALWQMIERGTPEILPLTVDDAPRMGELMAKYRDLPMDLADAALVRVAERERIPRVLTIDRRDFQIYRPIGIRRFEIIP